MPDDYRLCPGGGDHDLWPLTHIEKVRAYDMMFFCLYAKLEDGNARWYSTYTARLARQEKSERRLSGGRRVPQLLWELMSDEESVGEEEEESEDESEKDIQPKEEEDETKVQGEMAMLV